MDKNRNVTWRLFAVVAILAVLMAATPTAQTQELEPNSGTSEVGPRVIGGQSVNPADYPYFVRVTDTSSRTVVCGGTLIKRRWVLTAAHCVEGSAPAEITVLLGLSGSTAEQAVAAKRIYVHPEFQRSTLNADIALIRLSKKANTKSGQIATTNYVADPARPPVGTRQPILGFGRTSPNGALSKTLQMGQVTIKNCTGLYSTDNNAKNICAGGYDTTSCGGDSGGPLLVNNRVAGLVSYGTYSCIEPYGVYTRVAAYGDWIERLVAKTCDGRPVTVKLRTGQKPTEGPDVIRGTKGPDFVDGLGGDDVICGRGGDDTLIGGAGNDVLSGGSGSDHLNGSAGVDKCIGGTGRDYQKWCEAVESAQPY